MPYDEFEQRAFPPADAAKHRFTREQREPAGVA